MFKRYRFFAGLLLLGFLITSKAYALTFPKATGYVNDFANVLTSPTKNSLEEKLSALEKTKAIQFSVVTVPSLEGISIEEYSNRLFKEWGIGKKGSDNGLLLLVAPTERKVRFEVGYGLEATLTDAGTGRILDTYILPGFKADNYDKGIADGVNFTIGLLSGTEVLPTPATTKTSPSFFFENIQIFILLMVLLQYLGSFLARSKSFWVGGAIGAVLGIPVGLLGRSLILGAGAAAVLGLFGFILDFLLSKNYDRLKKFGKSTGFINTWGGFYGGSRSGGSSGFSGFGGGMSGGGGSSRSW